MMKEHRSIVLMLLLGVLAARVAGMIAIPIFDDAFITYRYARNLAAGTGFVYNAGEPVLGTTTPLFAALLGIPAWIGLPLPEFTRVLNLLLDMLSAGMLATLLLRGGRPLAAVFTALFFAVDPHLVRISVGGMETSVFLAVSLAAFFLFERRQEVWAIATAAMTFFIRPEGVLLVLILGGMLLLRRDWKQAAVAGGLAALIMLVPTVLIRMHYGGMVSQSVASKSSALFGPFLPLLQFLLAPNPLHILVLPLAIYGLLLAWRAGGLLRLITVWGVLYGGAYLLARPHVWTWYFMVPWTVVFLTAGLAAGELLQRWKPALKQRLRAIALTGTIVVAAGWAGLLAYTGPSPVTTRVYEPMRAWFASHDIGNARILASDIGAVGYFSGSYILDSEGLVSPQCVDIPDYGSEITAWQPEWLFVTVTQKDMRGVIPLVDEGVYTPVARFSISGAQSLRPSLEELPTGWQQDYLLYRRER